MKALNLGVKPCEFCGKEMVLTIRRDLERKHFCSRACRQRGRWARGEMQSALEESRKLAHTPEANAKKAHRGPDHPKWIEDRSKVKFRPRYEMTTWRKAVFERDNYTCQSCGQRGGRLQAHHVLSYAAYPEYRWELANGKTLCIECHKKTPNYASGGKSAVSVKKSAEIHVCQ